MTNVVLDSFCAILYAKLKLVFDVISVFDIIKIRKRERQEA